MANITSSSVANPTVITATSHGLADGATVVIAGHTGSTPDINGQWRITVTGANTFTIPVNVTAGGTGGVATLVPKAIVPISQKVMTAAQAATYIGSLPAELVWIGDAFRARLFDGNTLGGWQVGSPIAPVEADGFIQSQWLIALGFDAMVMEGGARKQDMGLYFALGSSGGKQRYFRYNVAGQISWAPDPGGWIIGNSEYFSTDDTLTPDLATWESADAGDDPPPTVRRATLEDLQAFFFVRRFAQANWNTTQEVTIATAGTFVQTSGLTSGGISGFTAAADGLTYTSNFPKQFKVSLTANVSDGSGNKVVAARIGIGAATIAASENRGYSQSTHPAEISTSWIVTLNTGDKVTAHFANITDDANLTIQRGQLVVTEI